MIVIVFVISFGKKKSWIIFYFIIWGLKKVNELLIFVCFVYLLYFVYVCKIDELMV